MWFWKIMVRFFMSLDSVLFNFISELYDLLIAISRTSILTQGDIAEFAGRIELLLGIFMLFKLSFSLITYIVNPDDFSDKSKGFGKLIQSAVVSLVMLILVPYIFQMAYNLQAKILDDNLLAKLILGEDISSSNGEDNINIIDKAGDVMAFQVMLPFFKPRVSVSELNDCVNLLEEDGFNEGCREALETAGLAETDLNNYVYGIENQSLGLTFRANTALSTTKKTDEQDEQFIIDYMYPISTVVAVVVCLLLVTFCIDVGLRSVKLAFLQLIYPIPVIAYMDPKAGKDGIFKKWYQMCISTFLSLFIRLIALYFGVYIIAKVADFGMYDIINGSQITNGFVIIFVIIGVLMFVKQLPKILENLGIKLDGDGKFTLNPLKKIEEGVVGGKRITGAAGGLAVGALHGRGLRGAAAGFIAGKGFGDAAKHQADYASKLREARLNGSTLGGRLGARFSQMTGYGGAAARLAREDKRYEKQIQNFDDAIKQRENSIAGQRDSIKRNESFTSSVDSLKDKMSSALSGKKFAGASVPRELKAINDEYRAKQEATSLAQAKLNNIDRSQFSDDASYETALQAANKAYLDAKSDEEKYLKKDAVEKIYNYAASHGGRTGNVDVDNLFSTMGVNASQAGVNINGLTMDQLSTEVDRASSYTTNLKNQISGVERDIERLQREKSTIEQERFDTRDRKAKIDADRSVIK